MQSKLAIAFVLLTCAYSQQQDAIYEGARLIAGDSSAPLENSAFVVRNGRITALGPKGSIQIPAGAARVDLTGKTVMPTLNNIHLHAGYEGYVSWSVENHTAENLLDHLEREAFYGVGTAMAMGEQPVQFAIEFQRNKIAALNIKQVKFWVDNRDDHRGSMHKMPPEVYTALIQEAHKHGLLVHAHATNLEDQKGVVKAGVDVLVHILMAEKVDDEFLAILREKRPYWTPVMGLGDRSELCDGDNPFIEQALPDSVIADIKAGKTWLPSPPCQAPPTPQFARREENLRYNFPKYIAAGARLVLGTDAGISAKYSFGFADHHEIGMYVRLGLTPAEAIVAATSRPPEVLRIHDTACWPKASEPISLC